jgi:hypothetical protein
MADPSGVEIFQKGLAEDGTKTLNFAELRPDAGPHSLWRLPSLPGQPPD